MKVEVYLKLTGIPYRAVVSSPRAAPLGKLPYVVLDDGRRIADSSVIVDHFEASREEPLDHGLDAVTRARAHLLKRTFEEAFYFVALWSRWVDAPGWDFVRPRVGAMVPAPLRAFLPALVRRSVAATTRAQGTARHSPEAIYRAGCADIEAFEAVLGGAPFFGGERPRSVDLTAFAFLANARLVDNPLKRAVQESGPLTGYVERMRARVDAAGA